jgi:hypothetical protein
MAFRRASYTMVEWRTIEANIKKRLEDLAGYCPQAVMYATLPIFEQSQRIVPVKTGRLKRSGYCRIVPAQGRRQARVEIGYGTGYGIYVHEDLAAYHAEPTQAKFLQGPLEEQRGDILPRIRDYLQQAMKGSPPTVPDEVTGGD